MSGVKGTLILCNQYHVGLYWSTVAILGTLAGMKDVRTQEAEGLAIAHSHR